jgi:chromosome segregation protein
VTRDRAAEALSAARVELARWQQERDSLVATKSRLEKQAASERDRVRRIEATIVEANERMAALEAEVEAIVTEHDQRLVEHKHALAEKQDAVEAHDAARVDVDRLDLETKNLRRELDEQREALSEVEMGLRELDMQAGHLQADVRERHNLELVEILVDFHHRALATEVERERVRELKRVISRMGDVNLTAIEEYEDVAARFETLSAQKIDLEQATNELQEAIDRIDATTRDRFKDTFEQVNEMFKRVFPRLFSGGQAELVMTQPDDLLETGVDILAQPPGKKVASLELLSGGEKALTAVSLVFAIFLIKPSPFCLLDEVDAPLDEANVGRFCDLVRELSERNQFIIITHNKRTMETADRLYGVTMEQKGVSKLVSVNLRRATASAAYAPN